MPVLLPFVKGLIAGLRCCASHMGALFNLGVETDRPIKVDSLRYSNKSTICSVEFTGTAGDSLAPHRGMAFSTRDRDNDKYSSNCAMLNRGAWWYKNCHSSNLNGLYLPGQIDAKGMSWWGWKKSYYSFKRSDMKIRPKDF